MVRDGFPEEALLGTGLQHGGEGKREVWGSGGCAERREVGPADWGWLERPQARAELDVPLLSEEPQDFFFFFFSYY